jgi:hypothetical protein
LFKCLFILLKTEKRRSFLWNVTLMITKETATVPMSHAAGRVNAVNVLIITGEMKRCLRVSFLQSRKALLTVRLAIS